MKNQHRFETDVWYIRCTCNVYCYTFCRACGECLEDCKNSNCARQVVE